MAPQDLDTLEADLIFVTVGADPRPLLPIPGLADHPRVQHPEAALADRRPFKRALILGGGPEGCEVADALKARHPQAEITIVELRRKVGLGLPSSVRAVFEERLLNQGIDTQTRKTVVEIKADGVALADKKGRKPVELAAVDLVVLAVGVVAPTDWPESERIRRLGDARAPATILEAVEAGWLMGRSI